jgi:hypothetical protein
MALIRNAVVFAANDSASACPRMFSAQNLGTRLRQKRKDTIVGQGSPFPEKNAASVTPQKMAKVV